MMKRAWALLFGNGWGFVVPYLALYEVGLYFAVSPATLCGCFQVLHSLFAAAVLAKAAANIKNAREHLEPLLFWSGLFLLFLLPGAYLEFPADPWSHFQRIFYWSSVASLNDHPIFYKFSYFWAWSWLEGLEPAARRFPLDVYSAFWQWLFSFQFYRLFRALGFSARFSMLQIFGVVALFGTNYFSFRYYALSSTPVAFVAYVAFLRLWVAPGSRFLVKAAGTGTAFWICWMNHKQAILFICVSSLALLLVAAYRRLSEKPERGEWFVAIGLALWLGGALAVAAYPVTFLELIQIKWWARLIGTSVIEVEYLDLVYVFSPLRTINPAQGYTHTIAIHGYLGLLFSLLYFRRFPVVAALSLMPVVLLLTPAFALVFASLTPMSNTYRILYTFPLSVALFCGIKAWLEDKQPRVLSSRRSYGVAMAVLAAAFVLWPAKHPWRNRLHFQLHKPDRELELRALDQTAQWLKEHKPELRGCRILSDDVTDFVIGAHLGWAIHSARTERAIDVARVSSAAELTARIEKTGACAVLAVQLDRVPPLPRSWAATSGHWAPETASLAAASGRFPESASALPALGWARHEVPPFYVLYLRP